MEIFKTVEANLHYQLLYGVRGKEPFDEWVLRKRSINIAAMVTSSVSGLDFSDFELGLYLKCIDPDISKFIRSYEKQMEEAVLKPDIFVKNLHNFYMSMAKYVREKNMHEDFIDFYEFFTKKTRSKIKQGHARIYNAYLSLILQQFPYLKPSEYNGEYECIGVSSIGALLWRKSKFPYSDCGAYDLEQKIRDCISGRGSISNKDIHKAYKKYGYEVSDLDEVSYLEHITRVYENNLYGMVPYTAEETIDMLPEEPYRHALIEFPREWKKTDFYEQELQHRKYMLPSGGVEAVYKNAKGIWKIKYREIFRGKRIVLLYRVWSESGEFSGHYDPMDGGFYSIYEHSSLERNHELIKNFILENYYILSCDANVDRKKNYAMRQVESFQKEFHYPYQPLVIFSCMESRERDSEKSPMKVYRRGDYILEKKSLAGYIRRLPAGQNASEEAVQFARSLGYDLPPDMTYVRPFQKHIRKKRIMET